MTVIIIFVIAVIVSDLNHLKRHWKCQHIAYNIMTVPTNIQSPVSKYKTLHDLAHLFMEGFICSAFTCQERH